MPDHNSFDKIHWEKYRIKFDYVLIKIFFANSGFYKHDARSIAKDVCDAVPFNGVSKAWNPKNIECCLDD